MNPASLHEITALHISGRLLQDGFEDRARELLVQLVTTPQRSLGIRPIRSLAAIMYGSGDWTDAIKLFRYLVSSGDATLENHICLAHCLFEVDERQAAEDELERAVKLCAQQQSVTRVEVGSKLRDFVFEQLAVHFLAGSTQKTRGIFRICSFIDPYIPTLLPEENRATIAALSDEAIRIRLDKALNDWQQTTATGGNADQPDRNLLRGKKVLLVMRKYFLSSSDSREHELGIFFRESAVTLGMLATEFPAEPFLNPRSISPDEQYAALDRLVRLILETRPDMVVFDNLGCADNRDGYLDLKTYKAVFADLKVIHPFRMVVFYPDSWSEESVQAIEDVREVADVVWHQNSALTDSSDPDNPNLGRLLYSVIPYSDELFSSVNSPKSLDAVFLGSLFAYNYPRAIWLMLIQERQIPCTVHLSNHTRSGSPVGPSVGDYIAFLAKVRMMVNFSSRSVRQKIMTGRAWESILAKCLLLEEDNEDIKRFFVPFVHYIPFRTIHELEAYIAFFNRNESLRSAIADRAHTWFMRNYSKAHVWRELFR